ncbi:hypothetical protein V8D89_003862 [Ganoderma adspersum]
MIDSSSSPGLSPISPSSFGAFFLGTSAGLIVYVFSVLQACRYFRLYSTDTRFLRGIVYTVLPLDLFHILLAIDVCYWHLVKNHSNIPSLIQNYWSFQLFTPVSVLVMLVCQLFYAHRVYQVCVHSPPQKLPGPAYHAARVARGDVLYRWIVLLPILGMLCSAGFGIAVTVKYFTLPSPVAFRDNATWMIAGIYGSAVITDIILAYVLVAMLWRSRTGRQRTDSVLGSMIAYTVSSGVLFSVIGAMYFLYAIVKPWDLTFCGISAFGAKVYVISTLTAINNRKAFYGRMMEDDSLSGFQTSRSHRQGQPSGGEISLVFATTTAGQASWHDATDSKVE